MQIVSRTITGFVAPLLLGAFATHAAARTLVIWLAMIILAHLFLEHRLRTPETHGTTT